MNPTYFHPKSIESLGKKQQLNQHQICCQNIRHQKFISKHQIWCQNIRSGNTGYDSLNHGNIKDPLLQSRVVTGNNHA